MSLSEKWINTVFRIATGKPVIRNIMTPVGAVIFFSFIAGVVIVSLYADNILEFKSFLLFPFDLILTTLFLFSGLSLTGYCLFSFFRSGGTPVPLNPPKKLITDGPYALSRNPMITGLFFILLGIGCKYNSITLTLIIAPLFLFLH